jgi:hypothetical protein
MTLHQPILMDFDGLHLLAPNGWPKLTNRQWADIESAMILTANGPSDAAGIVISDLEERMGVRPAHRKVISFGENMLRAELRRTQAAARKAERERSVRLLAPWKPPGPDLKLVAKADRKVKSGDPKQIKEGTAELVTLEEARKSRAEGMRISAEQAEVKACAEARGEEIVAETSAAKGVKGRLRILSRDGLERLFLAGAISPVQYASGMRYRDAYERVDPEASLKPMDYGRIFSPRHGGDGYAHKRAEWSNELLNVERQVIERGQHRHALPMLQQIAGNRRSIRSFGGSGGLRAAQIKGLQLALDICAEHFGVK